MSVAIWCGVAVAAGSLAMGVAGSMGASRGGASTTPPPPASSVTYNEDGVAETTQSYDAATNTWITKRAPLTEAQKADKAKIAELRTKMIDNLNTTPEDRVAAYNEYQQKFSDAAHSDVDPKFAKIARVNDEQANSTGMMGSRAYVDTKNELTKDQLKTDTDIATQAALAKEQLANTDRSFYASMLNQIDSGARADTLAQSQITQQVANDNNQKYANSLGAYTASNSAALANWQAQQAKSASYTSAGTGMAGGLLYLYGKQNGTLSSNNSGSSPFYSGLSGSGGYSTGANLSLTY